uniref:Carboxypeptidase-like regulatory domain-containing protein n=2 Tax=Janibacter limosus TaxID=53458 RepID=A0AC61U8W4_9MICO|nr:carboxypeptidase-like regulatory domain-containing protein [Janibacter limosus]
MGGRGSHMDWSHTDSAGDFSVATGGPIRHLLVATAPGWSPVSAYVDLTDSQRLSPFVMTDRLTVSGKVTDERGRLRPGASVVITKRTGGSVSWVRTDDEGRYRLPLPAAGSYDLTAVDRGVGTSRSQILTVGGQSLTVDLQLDQPGSLPGPVESD